MQIGTFRKNVMKTLGTKQAKLGLRVVSKDTQRTNLFHATVALKTNVGQLMQSLNSYVLGLQFSQEMKEAAFKTMGDIGYDLTILCRLLKVKMPTATKKTKLTGTRTAALLHLDGIATDLLALVEKGTFTGPKTKIEKKMVVMPNKGGVKEERDVEVVDMDAEKAGEEERQNQMKSLLAGAVDLYWRLSFDIFQQPPAPALEAKFNRLHEEFPNVQFDSSEEPDEDEKDEEAKPEEPVAQ